jgi:hypothetical protein
VKASAAVKDLLIKLVGRLMMHLLGRKKAIFPSRLRPAAYARTDQKSAGEVHPSATGRPSSRICLIGAVGLKLESRKAKIWADAHFGGGKKLAVSAVKGKIKFVRVFVGDSPS